MKAHSQMRNSVKTMADIEQNANAMAEQVRTRGLACSGVGEAVLNCECISFCQWLGHSAITVLVL